MKKFDKMLSDRRFRCNDYMLRLEQIDAHLVNRGFSRHREGSILAYHRILDLNSRKPGKISFMLSFDLQIILNGVSIDRKTPYVQEGMQKERLKFTPEWIRFKDHVKAFDPRVRLVRVMGKSLGYFIDNEPLAVIQVPVMLVGGKIMENGFPVPYYWIKPRKKGDDDFDIGYYIVSLEHVEEFWEFLKKIMAWLGEKILCSQLAKPERANRLQERCHVAIKILAFFCNAHGLFLGTLSYLLRENLSILDWNPFRAVKYMPLVIAAMVVPAIIIGALAGILMAGVRNVMDADVNHGDHATPFQVKVPQRLVLEMQDVFADDMEKFRLFKLAFYSREDLIDGFA